MWGTWWVWDARLTSVLVLFFLYLGYIALVNAFDDRDRGARAGSLLALVGVVNLPIIKFSVDWWNTLHQPASVLRLGGPTIDPSMLLPAPRHGFGFCAAVPLAAAAAHADRAQRDEGAGVAPLRPAAFRWATTALRRCRPLAPPGDRAVVSAIETWFAMGGYAGFVWPAYGVTAVVLGGLALHSWRRHRRSGDELVQLQRRSGSRG